MITVMKQDEVRQPVLQPECFSTLKVTKMYIISSDYGEAPATVGVINLYESR